jgi:serine protease Do
VIRKGQEKAITIRLGQLPNELMAATSESEATHADRASEGTNIPRFGIAVAPRTDRNGVVLTDLDVNGPAADFGFEVGDLILEVAGTKVGSAGDILDAIRSAEKSGRRTMLMRVKSGAAARYITWPVDHGDRP